MGRDRFRHYKRLGIEPVTHKLWPCTMTWR
jgi:hypothetical protein